MHIRDQRRLKCYSWIVTDHELKIHRIPTNTPQKFTSNRSPRDHCIENHKREREKKPSSYCLRTRRSMVDYSHIIGEAPMRMMNPSVMVLDWISWFWNLRWLDVFFVDSSRVSGIFGNL